MPKRDILHDVVKQALVKSGWEITDDPYRIHYGERFLYVDLGGEVSTHSPDKGQIVGAQRQGRQIAVEIKEFRGSSAIVDLEHAIGQYVLYRLLLNKTDPDRTLYLAVIDEIYADIFSEPIGEVVIKELPLQLIVIDSKRTEVQKWIPSPPIVKS
ncbi:XisH family protein [candidate division KSB1 bacterium]|nr:XisH family protein [candidate division KSB1 bacterium]